MYTKRIKPRTTDKKPAISWANGNMDWLEEGTPYVGLFVDHELDAKLDAAAYAAGWTLGTLDYLKEGPRTHWFPPVPTFLFFLLSGVPYTNMMLLTRNRNEAVECGIGCRWEKGERSKVAVQVVCADLIPYGYADPLMFAVSSTQTEDLLAVLLAHNVVLDRCEMLVNEKLAKAWTAAKEAAYAARDYYEEPAPSYRTFGFWEWAMPIVPGKRTKRGKGQTSRLTPILRALTQTTQA